MSSTMFVCCFGVKTYKLLLTRYSELCEIDYCITSTTYDPIMDVLLLYGK